MASYAPSIGTTCHDRPMFASVSSNPEESSTTPSCSRSRLSQTFLRPAFRTGSGLKLHDYRYTLQNGTARNRVVVSRGTLDAPTLLHYSSLPDRTALFAAGTPTAWSFYPGEGFGPTSAD